MKYLLIFLFVISSATVFCQSDRIDTDSIYSYASVGWEWYPATISRTINSSDFSFTYDIYRFNELSEEYLYRRITKTFDISGNLVEVKTQNYEKDNQEFVDWSVQSYDFDSLNRRVSYEFEFWDLDLNLWAKGIKSIRSEFNQYNDYNLLEFFFSDDTNEWVPSYDVTYERFYENDLIDSVSAGLYREDGTFNAFHDVSKYFYDSDERLILRTKYKDDVDNPENLGGLPDLDYHYIFEDNLYTRLKIDEYDNDGLPYPTDLTVFIRNSESLLLEKTHYVFFLGNSVDHSKDVYFYAEETAHITKAENLTVDLKWYSECHRCLNISISQLESNSSYQLFISDTNGKLVKYKTLNSIEEWTENYKLQSGIYSITLQRDNQYYSEQLIVK